MDKKKGEFPLTRRHARGDRGDILPPLFGRYRRRTKRRETRILAMVFNHKRQLAASLGMAALPSAIPQPLRNRTRLLVRCALLKLVRKDSPMASLR